MRYEALGGVIKLQELLAKRQATTAYLSTKYQKMIACFEHWECPDCFLCIISYKKIEDKKPECTTMKLMTKEELHAIQPVIRATIESAVKNILPKTVCSKEDVQSAVKSYADATRESQRKVRQSLNHQKMVER